MGVRGLGLLAAFAVCVAAGGAQADGMGQLSGNLTAGYDRYDFSKHSANQWDAGGSAVLTVANPGFNVQINANNSGIQIPKASDSDVWSYGGDVYWRDYAGDIGVNVTENSYVSGASHDYLSGGFFGEFFVFPGLTVRAKGGRFQGDADGWYGSTGLVAYPLDQVAISLTGDYSKFDHNGPHVTDGQISIEYLPVRDVPISLALGYTFARYDHASAGFTGNTNIFSIALKAYFGGSGRNGGLEDYQRRGATSWDSAPASILGASL